MGLRNKCDSPFLVTAHSHPCRPWNIHRNKQVLEITHDWCREFNRIVIGPVEIKISFLKGNPFS